MLKKHKGAITVPHLLPEKKHKARPSSSSCNKFCQKNTRGAIVFPPPPSPIFLLLQQILPKKHKGSHGRPPPSSCCSKHFKKTHKGAGIPAPPLFLLLKQMLPKKLQGGALWPLPLFLLLLQALQALPSKEKGGPTHHYFKIVGSD